MGEHECCNMDEVGLKCAANDVELFQVHVTCAITTTKNSVFQDFLKLLDGRVLDSRRFLPFHISSVIDGQTLP